MKQTDWLLMLCCVSFSFSTLLIYSLYVNGEVGRLNTVLVQPAMAICGVAAAIVLSKIDYHLMARLWKWHTALCYGLLLLLFPFGVQRVEWVDDRNWLPIPFLGINFQPSELLKISFIVTFAYHRPSQSSCWEFCCTGPSPAPSSTCRAMTARCWSWRPSLPACCLWRGFPGSTSCRFWR